MAGGGIREYRVDGARVAHLAARRQLVLSVTGAGDALVLVTCYPLDARPVRGRSRYVVTAVPVEGGVDIS